MTDWKVCLTRSSSTAVSEHYHLMAVLANYSYNSYFNGGGWSLCKYWYTEKAVGLENK